MMQLLVVSVFAVVAAACWLHGAVAGILMTD